MQFCQKADISKNLAGNAAISLFLAAIMHDYRHPGVNNSFLTKTFDSLSLRYNDQSILENFHSAEAFKVMMDPKFDLFREWSGDQVRAFRSTFIKCVLATDLSKSYEYTSKFMAAAASDKVESIIPCCVSPTLPQKLTCLPLHFTDLWQFQRGDANAGDDPKVRRCIAPGKTLEDTFEVDRTCDGRVFQAGGQGEGAGHGHFTLMQ
jgi:hypothetical protein